MLAAAVALLAVGVVLGSCGDTEELAPDATSPATPALTTAAPTIPGTPSPPAIPADWPTYADPDGFFTVRYPPTWFQRGLSLYSADPGSFDPLKIEAPPEIVEVEIGYNERRGRTPAGRSFPSIRRPARR